ncbi:hypothetical protein PFICI_10727 [Pestalotiopsis fici W106-1]|uniref:Carboxylic ester hydrolase n=1 Tax=Pestalotiopsis fici (strain W106-1 / CGMCC3.15140) TaxID=1229662 RepID=W3WSL2_PESFW|nr:uncharacterized protein PFICI_10727 [Pestalotiopsis fici W106-1]ETS76853.1 hypothetical protein PFICI_10727 [Pestalotiopsis fici W106-1]
MILGWFGSFLWQLGQIQAISLNSSSTGDISILAPNALDGAQNNGAGAILISQPGSYAVANTSCAQLSETIWSPDSAHFNAGLDNSILRQVYVGNIAKDQLFWVARNQNDGNCQGIDTNGHAHSLDCESQLPVLCTQSAPVSNSSHSDTAVKWQITHNVAGSTFTGYRDYHAWKFRGVRFAKKPDRFTYSSVFLEPGSVSAITAGADCVQPIGEVTSGSSEDCLFLNIWTSSLPLTGNSSNASYLPPLKPVMVYLYGGGFTSGSGKNPNTDGTNLASRGDVVVVSVNYRVGNVGFLAFLDGIHNGNYAVSDMVTALTWVQNYIKYFGGDADRVTVFGESAGAQGTHILLSSPAAKGLFHRAIMQSDPTSYPHGGFTWPRYASIEDAYRDGTTGVLNQTGCLNAKDQLSCLKSIDGFDLVNLETNLNGPVVDGTYIDQQELIVSKPGIASSISVMTGTNRDECGVYIDEDAYPKNGTTFATYFRDHVGIDQGLPDNYSLSVPEGPFSLSNASSPEQVFNATLRVASDGEFVCFDLAKAYSAAKHEAFKSVHVFQFNRTYSPSGYTRPWCDAPQTLGRPHGDPDGEYYKCHAGEQLVVFGNIVRSGQPDRDGLDVPFMQLTVDYWASFARAGDPNPDKGYLNASGHYNTLTQIELAGLWEAVDFQKPTMRLLQWNGAQVSFVETAQCEALGIPYDTLEGQ